MSDPFLGEIRVFAGNFAPRGWALCQGQLMSIAQNTALFSILGTTYGGNGQSTFGLPNLAGRCVLGFGQSTTGTQYVEGEVSGTESVSILISNLPPHTHSSSPAVSNVNADQTDPTNGIPAVANNGDTRNPVTTPAYTQTAKTGTGAAQVTGITGSGIPLSTMPPFLVINYIIALEGIFPSRS